MERLSVLRYAPVDGRPSLNAVLGVGAALDQRSRQIDQMISSPKTLVHGVPDDLSSAGDMLSHEIAGAPSVAALKRGED
jgi:hypothetical protein